MKVNLKEQIYEKEQTISPNKVTVTGGKSSVEKISDVILAGEEKDIDENKESEYDIKFEDTAGNEVNNIKSDSETAKLSIVVTNGKVIPINLKTTGIIPQGFILEGYELSKNNLNILGDSQNLEKIEAIDTEIVDMSSLEADNEMDVKLNLPEGISVQDGENTVKVKFKIIKEQSTTKDLVCNVQYENLNQAFSLESSNSTVNVTLTGIQTALDKISSQNINVIVDLSNVKEEGTLDYTPKATLTNGSNVTISAVGSANIVVKKKV